MNRLTHKCSENTCNNNNNDDNNNNNNNNDNNNNNNNNNNDNNNNLYFIRVTQSNTGFVFSLRLTEPQPCIILDLLDFKINH